jgi:hypothetical protein
MDMKFKPDEKMMVAYLYGELNQKERERVEYYLWKNPDYRLEYEKMVSLRKLLQQLPDKEVQNPIIVGTEERESRGLLNGHLFKRIASVAAVLLLLMVVGNLTDTRISLNKSGFTLAFDDPQPAYPGHLASAPDREEINHMIMTALSQFKVHELDSLSHTSLEKINELVGENETRLNHKMEQSTLKSMERLESLYQELEGQHRKFLEDYLLMATDYQAEQTKALLNQFAHGLQQIREEDLVFIQSRINTIEDDKNLFQYETGKVLSELIYHTANQEKP